MRILIYGINYYPEQTSTGKYTTEMASWLASRGHTVDVITALPYYPEWRIHDDYLGRGFYKENIDRVTVYRTPLYVPNKVTSLGRILLESSFSFWAQRYWLSRFFIEADCDVIVAVCPPLQVGIYPCLFSSLKRVPWIFHIQDLQVDAAVRLQMLGHSLLGRFLYWIENYLLKKATRVSTITEAMRDRIIGKGVPEDRIWLLPNWSDIEHVKPMPRDNGFRRELGIGTDKVLFMYAGNIGEKQGLGLVLEAANQVRNDSRIQFAMVGAGANSEVLRKNAEDLRLDNIRFLPVQSYQRLPEMLAAADVHMVVQKREAADIVMPSKLTNILAAGRPALATADVGTTLYNVICNHNTGIVVPPEEIDGFINALMQLCDSKSQRDEMGKNARKYAEEFLDKDTILLSFEQALLGISECKKGE